MRSKATSFGAGPSLAFRSFQPVLVALVSCLARAASVALGQPASLVSDIYPPTVPYSGAIGSNPTPATIFGGDAYFGAHDSFSSLHGLWRTDGTTQGTRVVFPETPSAMADFDGSLFFLAYGPTTNGGLWRSDGTWAGTTLIHEFDGCADNGLLAPGPLVASGGFVYFTAYTAGTGYELWTTDGTEAGTQIVKDVDPGPPGSYPGLLTPLDSKLLFSPSNGPHAGELWVTDGTDPGTSHVEGVRVDWSPIVSTDYLAFFQGCDLTPSCGLFSTDGTPEGTIRLTDDFGGGLFARGSIVLFFRGNELWRSDGTVSGTMKVSDLPAALGFSQFESLGSNAYFLVINSGSPGQLWKTDGTSIGTSFVADLGGQVLLDGELKTVGSTLFIASLYLSPQIWKSDGTAPGTVLVTELPPENPGPDHLGNLAAVQDRLFFTYSDELHGLEPWVSDGTASGTALLLDINREPTSSNPSGLGALDGTLLFAADDGMHYRSPWRSGGKPQNTQLVTAALTSVGTGLGGATPPAFVQVGRFALFSAYSPGNGYQLWRTDGTAAGTQLVKDVAAGAIAPLGGVGIFQGNGEIWRSDGTDAGTVPLVDSVLVYPPYFVEFQGTLYFLAASSGQYGLWKTDGSPAGTVLVAPLNPVLGNDYPQELVKSGNLLFFRATTPETSYELWKSDGTGPGTSMVTELVDGSGSAYIYRLTDSGGVLFFTAYDQYGVQLWKSDGTAPGTQKLTSIPGPWPYGPSPESLRDVNGTLYFSMADCEHGRELWTSDGTPEGTMLVKDIRPGPSDSSPRILAVVDGEMLLDATDDAHGEELWKSDGTEEGTLFFQELAPGPASSGSLYPAARVIGDRLYFTADDPVGGNELWTVPVAMLTGVAIDPSSGPASGGTTVAVSGNYSLGTTVQIGGALAPDVTIGSPSYLTATSPALDPGTLNDVVVSDPGSASTATLPGAWFADFLDVPSAHPFHDLIESIVRAGITAGCGGGNYCPGNSVTRAQMAVFLLKAEHGSSYTPPSCTGTFPDVPCPSQFADWIEQLAAEGITGGCGGGNFCPGNPVTRAQMAIFLLKTLLGSGYTPPTAAGIFADVPVGSFAADWIEDLYGRDITGGCSASPLLYCPNNPNTRGQMAVLLVRTFGL